MYYLFINLVFTPWPSLHIHNPPLCWE